MSAFTSVAPLSQRPPDPAARLDFLDGLRGLAALGVVVHHYAAAFYPTTLTGDPATAHLPGPWEAWVASSPILLNFRVCFFFVLSGLVLAESTTRTLPGWRTLLPQVVRRYVRLGAPVGASVALAYGLLLTHSFHNQQAAMASCSEWFMRFWHWTPTFRQFVGDALFGVLVRGEELYNSALWTMRLELKGSLLVLGALAVAGRRSWRLALYAVLALACLAGPFDSYYVAFMLGLGLHDCYRRQWHRQLSARARFRLVLSLLVLATITANYPETEHQITVIGPWYAWLRWPGADAPRTVNLYHTVGAGALLAVVLLSTRLQGLVASPFLRRVGKRAFSLYLLHFLLLGTGSAWLFVWLRAHYSYHASFGLMVAASGLVLVSITEGFYRLVDIPSHAMARWVSHVIAAALAYLPARG